MSRERDAYRRRRDEQWDEDKYESNYKKDEEYEEYQEELPRRRPRQRRSYPRPARSSPSPVTRSPYPPSSRSSRAREPHAQSRQSSVWPSLLTGCAIGVILAVFALAAIVMTGIYSLQNGKISIPLITPANRTISTQETLTVPLSSISQIVVCDVIGNVILKADPTISKPTVTVTKNVQASSQTAADQQFQQIVVTMQPPETVTEPLSCTRLQATATPSQPIQTNETSSPATTTRTTSTTLTVNVTMPPGSSNASVDMTIVLPPNVLPASGPSTIVSVETAGNISIDGISGILNIKNDSGNPQNSNEIKVMHAALADGSRLSTTGAISFDGYLAQASDPNKTAFYILEGEKQIDITLPSTINVTLEAYAVSGSINSQIPLQQNLLQKDKGMTSYHGPLNVSVGPPVNAQLTLHVGLGNVNIHQAQSPGV
jgi:hypothetical protein